MSDAPAITHHASTCPHDCPSACALNVEVINGERIGRIHGAKDQSYTDGVICAKVARYQERIHHPDRLLYPLRRTGPKGSGQFERISWQEAIKTIVARFNEAEKSFGAESVWPYYYAGTMGRIQRNGINRLTHVKDYSRFYGTICTAIATPGFIAGTGKLMGPDPREMQKSDVIVLWGTNAVATQVNVMHHAMKARKERGTKIIVVDIYHNATMQQADLALCLRPGTDGALACAIMHILFRDGYADHDYMQRFTDAPRELEAHLRTRTPQWAADITGLSVDEIEACGALIGAHKKTYLRLGYGFTRQRNGAVNMHAATSIASVLGAWQEEGGGAFFSNSGIFNWKQTLVEGTDRLDERVRVLDQSRLGAILCGDPEALHQGPPVKAMLIQNTNPMNVAPDQNRVRQGFMRSDLFVAVHEQFMTETALMADIVLPATMFLEHDDIYSGGGHQHIQLGKKIIEPPGECRSNHEVICAIAEQMGIYHLGFSMTARALIDSTLHESGWGSFAQLEKQKWIDVQPDFATSHYLNGFAWPDKKFRFRVDWLSVPTKNYGPRGRAYDMPSFPDYWDVNENTDAQHPFRLATSPSQNFLNSTFNETPSSRSREGKPRVKIHPDDAALLGIAEDDKVILGNERGQVILNATLFSGLPRGVLISEGVWGNADFDEERGINSLTGADPVAPFGGAAFHDNHVWVKRLSEEGRITSI
jgi:anaerobic selenocysteine-containing dehydrogenase